MINLDHINTVRTDQLNMESGSLRLMSSFYSQFLEQDEKLIFSRNIIKIEGNLNIFFTIKG